MQTQGFFGKDVLKTVELGETPCEQVRELVEQRLAAIREEVSQLQAIERRIEQASLGSCCG